MNNMAMVQAGDWCQHKLLALTGNKSHGSDLDWKGLKWNLSAKWKLWYFKPLSVFDVAVHYVHRLFIPVALKFPIAAPTGLPRLLQFWHGQPGVKSRHSHILPFSWELSVRAGINKTHSIDIVRHHTKKQGRSGILPVLAYLILYRGIKYHMLFMVRKGCGIRTHSLLRNAIPVPFGKKIYHSFWRLLHFQKKIQALLLFQSKLQQHNMFWTPKIEWMN